MAWMSFLLAILTKRNQRIQGVSLIRQQRPRLGDAKIVPRKNQAEMAKRDELLRKAGLKQEI